MSHKSSSGWPFPESGSAAGDDLKQLRHGIDHDVHLDVQVVSANLLGQVPGSVFGCSAAVHRPHVDSGKDAGGQLFRAADLLPILVLPDPALQLSSECWQVMRAC